MAWYNVLSVLGVNTPTGPAPVPTDSYGGGYVADPETRELLASILVELRVISRMMKEDIPASVILDTLDQLREDARNSLNEG